ncbi:transcription initiation factor TFIID subunit 11-like [Astyanax mexicanus]|uniref:Transcription initiation factor TFIID subunit 11-like n=1 Tax=Astyanax mexicanus TaxID=7994 RepID=A0A8T2KXL5_ASTMX|nr:transcription initiation factor TFIID subunit 11-like [Astyanax mexicanus]
MDEDDYENAAIALQQRKDSDESGEDYVDIDDDLEKRRVANNTKFAGAKNTNQINCTRNDSEDEDDDYENAEKEGLFDSDDDYINVAAEEEETEIQCIGAKNTNKTTCLMKNTETTVPEKEDSDETDDDYINVDETEAQNQCADANYTQATAHEESDMEDDDYEDPDANIQQIVDSDFSDEDYINVN